MNIQTNIYAILFLFFYPLTALPDTDSTGYYKHREKALFQGADAMLVEAADALAGAGLYAEAAELLMEHVAKKTDAQESPREHKSLSWRISTGLDYYRIEDIDSTVMTPDELRDYKRLTETPLSVWARARTVIKPGSGFVEEIVPEAYVSAYKARMDIPVRFSVFGRRLSFEPGAVAEKWFRSDASWQTEFKPAAAASSDMGGFYLRAVGSGNPDNAGLVDWSLPFIVDWEHYRRNRPGYESRIEYRFTPIIDMRFKKHPMSLRFNGEARGEDYYGPGNTDTLDAFRFFAGAEAAFRPPLGSMFLALAWMGDRYSCERRIAATDRMESSLRVVYNAAGLVSPGLRVRGISERENRRGAARDSLLYGTEILLRPEARFAVSEAIRVTPFFLWERRGNRQGAELWEGKNVFEPGAGVELVFRFFDISVRGSYRSEKIDAEYRHILGDSRSLRAGADGGVSLSGFLSFNIIADYQYRRYLDASARVSENLTLGSSISARF